jgi:hypothetical protein
MIEASTKGPKKDIVNRRIKRILDKDTRLLSGGTEDEMYYANAGQDEKIKEREGNFVLASKFGQLQGVEMTDDASSWTPAMREIMETGKVSAGGIGIEMGADVDQVIYDENGRTYGSVMRMFSSDTKLDRVHYKKAANYDKLASRFNSKEEGADMIAMDAMSGGGMLRGMEAQLEVMKGDRADGARVIETGAKNKDGSMEQLDMDAAIKNLTEAISKAKADDGKGQTVQEMRVTTLVVERQENK